MNATRKYGFVAVAALVAGGIGYWAIAQPRPASLPELVPPGPLLYLEAKDLGALLGDWSASPEKAEWIKSDAYQVFTRSRLAGRLEQAQTEFATAAGAPPDSALLQSVAGAESALAVYDIGALEILFLTKLPAAKAAESVLWKSRTTAQSRRAAGAEYYVKIDKATNRTVAFAAAGGWLILGTREDLVTGALALLSNPAQPSLRRDRWFDLALASAANSPHELRMAAHMERLAVSPHFRSYWIQRNVSELTPFRSALADLERAGGAFTERRSFERSTPIADATPGEAGVAQLVRLVPDQAGLYRAWASITPAQAVNLVRDKILGEPGFAIGDRKVAPTVSESDGAVGGEGDLERRIDEAPFVDDRAGSIAPALTRYFTAAKVTAGLQVSSHRAAANGVFVAGSNVVVLAASEDWNSEVARAAFTEAASNLWTAGGLGAGWTSRRAGTTEFFELNGLAGLALATSGRLLLIADRAAALQEVLARLSSPAAAQGAVYAAGYRHASELPHFERTMRLIDYPLSPAPVEGGGREPAFFSGTLASLGRVLGRTQSATIMAHDNGARVTETVVYRLRP